MKAETSRGDQRPEVASRAFADSSTFWTGASQERQAVHSVHFKSKQDAARSDLPPTLREPPSKFVLQECGGAPLRKTRGFRASAARRSGHESTRISEDDGCKKRLM